MRVTRNVHATLFATMMTGCSMLSGTPLGSSGPVGPSSAGANARSNGAQSQSSAKCAQSDKSYDLAPGADYEAAGTFGEIAAADMNGDGYPDLVFGDPSERITGTTHPSLGIMLNQKNGTFGKLQRFPWTALDLPAKLVVGDFDGDGTPDVVGIGADSGSRQLMLNQGDGTMGLPTDLPPEGWSGTPVAADMNGDGKLDLVSLARGNVSVFLNSGKAKFAGAARYKLGRDGIAIADFNGDKRPDLASAFSTDHAGESVVEVDLNQGGGRFKDATTTPFVRDDGHVNGVSAGDLDRDGKVDLVVLLDHAAHGSIFVMRGKGDGTFMAPVAYAVANEYASSVAIADLNGDGTLDVAVAATTELVVYMNPGDGKLGDPMRFSANPTGSVSTSADIAVADFNHSGILGVVVNQPGGYQGHDKFRAVFFNGVCN